MPFDKITVLCHPHEEDARTARISTSSLGEFPFHQPPLLFIMSSSGDYLPHIDLRDDHSSQLDATGPTMDEISPYYGYIPSLPATTIFTVLFTISTSTCGPPRVYSSQLTCVL